jgi:hypothetical protein
MPRDIIPENVRAGSETWLFVVYKGEGGKWDIEDG